MPVESLGSSVACAHAVLGNDVTTMGLTWVEVYVTDVGRWRMVGPWAQKKTFRMDPYLC